MQGLTRTRTRSRGLQAALRVALPAAVGMQLAFVSTTQAAPHRAATLTVTIAGLPPHVRGNVTLTGPGKKSRLITTTTKLTNVVPGTYTVAAHPVALGVNTYRPAVTVCLRSRRCSAISHGRIALKAGQRVAAQVAYKLGKPLTSPSSPAPAPSQPSSENRLASRQSETGGWSVTISVPAGGPQTQADGAISFPIPVKRGERVKITYRNERAALEPSTPCVGSVNQPTAEPGYLCVYRGGAGLGSKESEDKNAKFVQFEDFFGESINETGEANSGDLGVLIVFRTNEFALEGTRLTLAKAASLTASGSWALTAR